MLTAAFPTPNNWVEVANPESTPLLLIYGVYRAFPTANNWVEVANPESEPLLLITGHDTTHSVEVALYRYIVLSRCSKRFKRTRQNLALALVPRTMETNIPIPAKSHTLNLNPIEPSLSK